LPDYHILKSGCTECRCHYHWHDVRFPRITHPDDLLAPSLVPSG
jgi:hypothetical protein